MWSEGWAPLRGQRGMDTQIDLWMHEMLSLSEMVNISEVDYASVKSSQDRNLAKCTTTPIFPFAWQILLQVRFKAIL